jgi:hypothetical protein
MYAVLAACQTESQERSEERGRHPSRPLPQPERAGDGPSSTPGRSLGTHRKIPAYSQKTLFVGWAQPTNLHSGIAASDEASRDRGKNVAQRPAHGTSWLDVPRDRLRSVRRLAPALDVLVARPTEARGLRDVVVSEIRPQRASPMFHAGTIWEHLHSRLHRARQVHAERARRVQSRPVVTVIGAPSGARRRGRTCVRPGVAGDRAAGRAMIATGAVL